VLFIGEFLRKNISCYRYILVSKLCSMLSTMHRRARSDEGHAQRVYQTTAHSYSYSTAQQLYNMYGDFLVPNLLSLFSVYYLALLS
jgi:hypothetical protein